MVRQGRSQQGDGGDGNYGEGSSTFPPTEERLCHLASRSAPHSGQCYRLQGAEAYKRPLTFCKSLSQCYLPAPWAQPRFSAKRHAPPPQARGRGADLGRTSSLATVPRAAGGSLRVLAAALVVLDTV